MRRLLLLSAVLTLGSACAQEVAQLDPVPPATGVTMPPAEGRYRISGERALRPAQIGDDGVHTYIIWTEEQALPAVFAISPTGTEEMVDGYMRQGIFTIDRIHQKLVFRIDKKAAKAERIGN
jgi:type IV secretion system protein VirB9